MSNPNPKIGNTTVALSDTVVKTLRLKGHIQRCINDMALLNESLNEALHCKSIATTMFYMAAAERYTEKVKEDICQFITAAKDNGNI